MTTWESENEKTDGGKSKERGKETRTDSSGFERRLDLQSLQPFPVDPAEEQMILDVPLGVLSSTQTLARVLRQELTKTGGTE